MNIQKLNDIFSEYKIEGDKIVIESNLSNVIKLVKETYHFDILKEIIANDLQDKGIELIYKLYNREDEENLLISITVKDSIESISDIFDSAIMDEKEIYDMFGIIFTGNKELKRLYMPEGWVGNPLKKDYKENDNRLKWND